MTSIEIIKTKQTALGEAPHWCPVENVLYFLDILNAEIFRYDPVSNKCTSVKVEQYFPYSKIRQVPFKKLINFINRFLETKV